MMKYLNKIVFINSAHIPYAEVKIDGNVHFIGTQGVGKSTILRAILFFYNADSTKLGITKEKKSFLEYYFPFDDSYIIYEVKSGNRHYCVCAFKANGRVAIRFIDSHFDSHFFIDEAGNAFAEWKEINKRVDKNTDISKRVEKYEEYRDILFGNNRLLAPGFRKYALLNSSSYRNIPRTIQNVFLNSKLEAEFIKQTIIMSMNEEETSIDLMKYSRHIDQFQQQLRDIGKWKDKDKLTGKNEISSLAERIVELWRGGRSLRQQRNALAAQLNYAYAKAVEKLPATQYKLDKELMTRKEQYHKLNNLSKLSGEKEDKLKEEITLLADRVNVANRKNKEYEIKNIREIILRVERKEEFVSTKQETEKKLSILLSQTADVNAKYEQLKRQEINAHTAMVNIKNSSITELKDRFLEQKKFIDKQYSDLVEQLRAQSEEQIEEQRDKISALKDEINHKNIRKNNIQQESLFKDEKNLCKEMISNLEGMRKDADTVLEKANNSIESLRRNWETETKLIDKEKENAENDIQRKREDALFLIKQIEEKLDRAKGSFYEWLNEECPNWENTVGKVVDENTVLFNQNLAPRKVSSDNSFFGVEIDLSEVNKSVKSIKDYELEKQALNRQVEDFVKEMAQCLQQANLAKEKLANKFSPQIKKHRDEIKLAELNILQSEKKLKEQRALLGDWEHQANEEKTKRLQSIEREIDDVTNRKLVAEEGLEKLKEDLKRKIDNRKKEQRSLIKEKERLHNDRIESITKEKEQAESEHETKLAEIENNKHLALHEHGVDTDAVRRLESVIENATSELGFIEDNYALVIEYRKDKRELFDKLPEYKLNKQKAEAKLAMVQEQNALQEQKIKAIVDELSVRINDLQESVKSLQDNIEEVDNLKSTEDYAQLTAYTELEKSDMLCHDIIAQLYENEKQHERNQNRFKESSRKFTTHFTPENIFSFKVELMSDDDFDSFADNLNDFMEENRLEFIEQQTRTRFVNIIHTFAQDMNSLLEKESEIQKVISDINKDFDSRGKFALVIRLIELKRVDSERPIIVLLKRIRQFSTDHASELGEMNLFSTGDSEKINRQAIELISAIVKEINVIKEKKITLSDSFDLQFRIIENDNDSGFVSKLSNVGSDGTDVLVKAMINIMLLNVFKDKASKNSGEFKLHCMMDEIGKLHPNNIKGILDFANARNILLINSSPTSYRAVDYKYTYLLSKNAQSDTQVKMLVNVGS